MPLLTLFSSPKPFVHPHIATIQRNAIRSWTLLPDAEVLLMGAEEGLAEAARDLNVRHVPQVRKNEKGTPLISSMLELARAHGTGELLCIINADMILTPDFIEAARQAKSLASRFVMVSQRWDYDLKEPLDFSPGWQERLRADLRAQAQLHKPAGSDFFLFPRDCYPVIPDFAIGRAGWDNWMIYKARAENYAVIDATPSITLIHQNHDYSHLAGAKPHYDHPESRVNTELAGGQAAIRYTLLDATHQLWEGKLLRPKLTSARLLRHVELILRKLFFFLPEEKVEALARPKRWRKRIEKFLKS